MAILPLPQFEADVEADRKVYEALKAPRTLVVRFGVMKLVGEFPNDSGAKPGCGSKMVVRTHRGTEIGEMLTSTCPNSGCSKSVSRQDMLNYIENSGGRDYPFFQEGRVLRVATAEDMQRQEELEQSRHALRTEAKRIVEEMQLPIKIVDAETILGNERVFMYYYSEERIDLRDLAPRLARIFHNRVELRQVGARDEARITADYERCGQYCCCKNFLKVLKPISMKSAKIQKATLDPLKISGRCGRLMCCLRYEDETYETLRKRLPKKKQRVGTPEGDGFVIDTQILTQLVLVQLDDPEPDGKLRQAAIPVENLSEPISKTQPPPAPLPPPRSSGARPSQGSPPRPQGGTESGPRPAFPPRDRRPEGDRPPQGPSRQDRAPQRRDDRPADSAGTRTESPLAPDKPQNRQPPRAQPRDDRRRPDNPDRSPQPPRAPQFGSDRGPMPPRQQPPAPRGPEHSDDFGPDEIDELLGDGPGGPAPSGPPGGPASTGQPGTDDRSGPRRRRRRRRGGGGGGGGRQGGGAPGGGGAAPSG